MAAYRSTGSPRSRPASGRGPLRRTAWTSRTLARRGSRSTGTLGGWPFSTATSTRSSAPTPATGRSPHGSQDTAEAFEEIGEIDLAIDWAKQATDFDRGHQSLKAAGYWCTLLGRAPARRAARGPAERVPALAVLDHRRRPLPGRGTVVAELPRRGDAALAASPRDAVLFALLTLKDVQLAWELAYSLGLDSDDRGATGQGVREGRPARRAADPRPGSSSNELIEAGAQHYRIAARRLAKMRKLAAGSDRRPRSTSSSPSCARPPPSAAAAAGVRPRRPALIRKPFAPVRTQKSRAERSEGGVLALASTKASTSGGAEPQLTRDPRRRQPTVPHLVVDEVLRDDEVLAQVVDREQLLRGRRRRARGSRSSSSQHSLSARMRECSSGALRYRSRPSTYAHKCLTPRPLAHA